MSYNRETFSGYLQCPLCDAEVPISEEDKTGDQIYCPYCQCPLKLRKKADRFYLDEDF